MLLGAEPFRGGGASDWKVSSEAMVALGYLSHRSGTRLFHKSCILWAMVGEIRNVVVAQIVLFHH
jgi:hypothetical protein